MRAFLALLVAVSIHVNAEVIISTWVGETDYWGVAANWDPEGIPNNLDLNQYVVIIDSPGDVVTVEGVVSVFDFTLRAATALEIEFNSLTIDQGVFEHSGLISFTQSTGQLCISGEVTYDGTQGRIGFLSGQSFIGADSPTTNKLTIPESRTMTLFGIESSSTGTFGSPELGVEINGELIIEPKGQITLAASEEEDLWSGVGAIRVLSGGNANLLGRVSDITLANSGDFSLGSTSKFARLKNLAIEASASPMLVTRADFENVAVVGDILLTQFLIIQASGAFAHDGKFRADGGSLSIQGEESFVLNDLSWESEGASTSRISKTAESGALTIRDGRFSGSAPLQIEAGVGIEGEIVVEGDVELDARPHVDDNNLRTSWSNGRIIATGTGSKLNVSGELSQGSKGQIEATAEGEVQIAGTIYEGSLRNNGGALKIQFGTLHDLCLEGEVAFSNLNLGGSISCDFNLVPLTSFQMHVRPVDSNQFSLEGDTTVLFNDAAGNSFSAAQVPAGASLEFLGGSARVGTITGPGEVQVSGSAELFMIRDGGPVSVRTGAEITELSAADATVTVEAESRIHFRNMVNTIMFGLDPDLNRGPSGDAADFGIFALDNASLTNGIVEGALNVPDTFDVTVSGTLTNNGVIRGSSESASFRLQSLDKSTTITGSGAIELGTSGALSAGQLINQSNTIRGGGGIVAAHFINQGVLESTMPDPLRLNVTQQFVNEGDVVAGAGGVVAGQLINFGDITVPPGGTLELVELIMRAGNLSAQGLLDVDIFTMEGGVYDASQMPYNASLFGGHFRLSGDFQHEVPAAFHVYAGGTLEMRLGGYDAGLNHDTVFTQTNSTFTRTILEGTLVMHLLPGFEPQLGDEFVIIRHGGVREGEFRAILNASELTIGFETLTQGNQVVVRVIEGQPNRVFSSSFE